MAIIIPSKNIYDLQHQKIRKNNIDVIEAETKKINISKDFDALVYSEDIDTTDFRIISFADRGDGYFEDADLLQYFNERNLQFSTYSYYSIYYYVYGAICGSLPFYKKLSFSIPKQESNKYIQDIFDGAKTNGESNIKSSVTYRYNKGWITAIAKLVDGWYTLSELSAEVFKENWETRTSDLPSPSVSTKKSFSQYGDGTVSVSVTPKSATDLKTVTITYDKETETYNCSFEVLCGFYKFSGLFLDNGNPIGQSGGYPSTIKITDTTIDDNGDEVGFFEAYEPLSVQISFYGNTLTLDIKDGKLIYGDVDGKKPFLVQGNELIQESNSYSGDFSKILEEYKNGKETAKIVVSVGEYYDEGKNLVISTKTKGVKMSFEIGDIVTPMVFGADGKDRPLSNKDAFSPKNFRVCGTRKYYDGAVWQELVLQEKTD